jgi:hypothetical protein
MDKTMRIPLHKKRMGRQAGSPTDSLYASIVRHIPGFVGCFLFILFLQSPVICQAGLFSMVRRSVITY